MVQQIVDMCSSFLEEYPWILSIFAIFLSLFAFTRILRLVFGYDSYSGLFDDYGSGFCEWFRSLWVKVKNFIMSYVLAFWDSLHVHDDGEDVYEQN